MQIINGAVGLGQKLMSQTYNLAGQTSNTSHDPQGLSSNSNLSKL